MTKQLLTNINGTENSAVVLCANNCCVHITLFERPYAADGLSFFFSFPHFVASL